jgi:hypothetical protein
VKGPAVDVGHLVRRLWRAAWSIAYRLRPVPSGPVRRLRGQRPPLIVRPEPEVVNRKLLLLMTICALGGVASLIEYGWQQHVQDRIDAHRVRVNATIVAYDEHTWNVRDPAYILAYEYEARSRRAELRSLPADLPPGTYICLDIDATHPEHARRCNSRGDTGTVGFFVVFFGGLFVFAGIWWLIAYIRRSRPRRTEYLFEPAPAAPTAARVRPR